MNIKNKIAIITGAGGGIGFAIAQALARKGARAVGLVDREQQHCAANADVINAELNRSVAHTFAGDVCDAKFRAEVFTAMQQHGDTVRICIPAAGILRDAMAVKINRDTGKAELYDEKIFREVLNINLVHPVYWTMQMLAHIAEHRAAAGLKKWQPDEDVQGAAVLIGSVSSRGNRGQISYSSAKSALNAAAKTLNAEGMYHGVQTKIIHPGMVNTPMLKQLPDGYFDAQIKPLIPLGRLIEPHEIADAVCALIENPIISGQLWADGGLTPMA